jgi:hypothetical protein
LSEAAANTTIFPAGCSVEPQPLINSMQNTASRRECFTSARSYPHMRIC